MISLTPAEGPTHTFTFTIATEPGTGADVARCGQHSAQSRSSRGCAARALARVMVDAGVSDGPIEARGVDGRLRYRVRSLHAFARWTLEETPKLGVRRWRPVNFAAFAGSPAVQSVPATAEHPDRSDVAAAVHAVTAGVRGDA